MSALEGRIRDAYSAADSWGPSLAPPLRLPARRRRLRLVVPATGLVCSLLAAGIVYTLPETTSPREAGPMAMLQPAAGEIAIFLCAKTSANASCGPRDVTSAERAGIERSLRRHPGVRTIQYESQEQAFAEFKQRFRDLGVVESVRVGDIPASFQVKYNTPADIPKIKKTLAGRSGVDQVVSGK